jgi:hypothetical protein
MAKPLLYVVRTSGSTVAKLLHDVYGTAAVDIDGNKRELKRRYYPSKRPGNTKITIAGVITIPEGTEIAIQSHKSGGSDPDYHTVLTAGVSGGKLLVVSSEHSTTKLNGKDRKANKSKLRRNIRPGEERFYVWTRDQYRFTLLKQ